MFAYAYDLSALDNELQNQIKKYQRAYRILTKYYIDKVDTARITDAAIKGLINELDPHSTYYNSNRLKEVDEDLSGNYFGIGISSNIIDDTLVVRSVVLGSPAYISGIQSGDRIISADGYSLIKTNDSIASKYIRGDFGSRVKFEIKRPENPRLISIVCYRDLISINSIASSFIIYGTDIAYIKLKTFSSTTDEDMEYTLKHLKAQGMKKLILDLRDNSGGYLYQAKNVVNFFISQWVKIVYTKGKLESSNESFFSTKKGDFSDLPLIILINRRTASASEIVAGAIQDLDRGLILGETSFGKGLVQRLYRYPDSTAIKLTISRYYTPSGRCIQRPFSKDKDLYRQQNNRITLFDGASPDDLIQLFKDSLPSDSLPPIYKTKYGRNVLGGGGITPDYYFFYDSINYVVRNLYNNHCFFLFMEHYITHKKEKLNEYRNDYFSFLRNFHINSLILKDFRYFCKKRNISIDDKDFDDNKQYFSIIIKAEIANRLWGENEYQQIMLDFLNRHINKAIELFPKAETLVDN